MWFQLKSGQNFECAILSVLKINTITVHFIFFDWICILEKKFLQVALIVHRLDLNLFPGATPTSEVKHMPCLSEKEKLFDRQASQADTSRPFLASLAEGRVQDPCVKTFLTVMDKYLKHHHLFSLDVPSDHPLEEVSRWPSYLF